MGQGPFEQVGVLRFAAQGLAYAGRITGTPTVVVMPEGASPVKAEATRQYGARVVLHGTAVDAFVKCQEK